MTMVLRGGFGYIFTHATEKKRLDSGQDDSANPSSFSNTSDSISTSLKNPVAITWHPHSTIPTRETQRTCWVIMKRVNCYSWGVAPYSRSARWNAGYIAQILDILTRTTRLLHHYTHPPCQHHRAQHRRRTLLHKAQALIIFIFIFLSYLILVLFHASLSFCTS